MAVKDEGEVEKNKKATLAVKKEVEALMPNGEKSW